MLDKIKRTLFQFFFTFKHCLNKVTLHYINTVFNFMINFAFTFVHIQRTFLDCGRPGNQWNLANGLHLGNGMYEVERRDAYTESDKVRFTCNAGFTAKPSSGEIVCTKSGWNVAHRCYIGLLLFCCVINKYRFIAILTTASIHKIYFR